MKQAKKLFGAAVMILAAMTILTGRIGAQQTDALVSELGGKAAVNGSVVTLNEDVSVKNTVTVPAGVTLDLTAGGKLTLQNNTILTVNGIVNANAGYINIDRAAVINGSGTISLKSKGPMFVIGRNQKLTLDGVTLAGLGDNNDSVIYVERGELIMKSGTITGNTRNGGEDWSAGGGVIVGGAGKFTMEGGAITGNTVRGGWAGGGGVYSEGAFTMNGGRISGNSVICIWDDGLGGGVHVVGGGKAATFILAGGEISGNTASQNGGGVFCENAAFTMKGGTISGNRATGEWGAGGGVFTGKNSTFTMEGGVIHGNSAVAGGGVTVFGVDGRAVFIMKGGRIQGNENSDGFTRNTAPGFSNEGTAALWGRDAVMQWGTGGTYTKGGAAQTGGRDIGSTDDTLIAIPKK